MLFERCLYVSSPPPPPLLFLLLFPHAIFRDFFYVEMTAPNCFVLVGWVCWYQVSSTLYSNTLLIVHGFFLKALFQVKLNIMYTFFMKLYKVHKCIYVPVYYIHIHIYIY